MSIENIKEVLIETIKEVEDYEELFVVCDVYTKITYELKLSNN